MVLRRIRIIQRNNDEAIDTVPKNGRITCDCRVQNTDEAALMNDDQRYTPSDTRNETLAVVSCTVLRSKH